MTKSSRLILIILAIPFMAHASMTAILSKGESSSTCETIADGDVFYPISGDAIILLTGEEYQLDLDFRVNLEPNKLITPDNFQAEGFELEVASGNQAFLVFQQGSSWPRIADKKVLLRFNLPESGALYTNITVHLKKAGKDVAMFEFPINIVDSEALAGGGNVQIKIMRELPVFMKVVDLTSRETEVRQLSFQDTFQLDKTHEYQIFLEVENWAEANKTTIYETIDFKNRGLVRADWEWDGKGLKLKRKSANQMYMLLYPDQETKGGNGLLSNLEVVQPDIEDISEQELKEVQPRIGNTKVNPDYFRITTDPKSKQKVKPIIIAPKNTRTEFQGVSQKEAELKTKEMERFQLLNAKAYKNLDFTKVNTQNIPQTPRARFQIQDRNLQMQNGKFKTPSPKKPSYYTAEVLIKKFGEPFDMLKTITFEVK